MCINLHNPIILCHLSSQRYENKERLIAGVILLGSSLGRNQRWSRTKNLVCRNGLVAKFSAMEITCFIGNQSMKELLVDLVPG